MNFLRFIDDDEKSNESATLHVIRGYTKGPFPELKKPIKLVNNSIPEPEVSNVFMYSPRR